MQIDNLAERESWRPKEKEKKYFVEKQASSSLKYQGF